MTGLIMGSPKRAGSASATLLTWLRAGLPGQELYFVDASSYQAEELARLCQCDRVVAAFPLYVDALPAHVVSFLMAYQARRQSMDAASPALLYGLVNCGFYEGVQCALALQILEHFAAAAGMRWGGGIGLGGVWAAMGGGAPAASLRPLEAAVGALAQRVLEGVADARNQYASIGIPRWLYQLGGNQMWRTQAKRAGLAVRDLYRK